jgi:hypothetical protein
MEQKEIPDIVLIYPDDCPDKFIDDEIKGFHTNKLNLKIQKVEKESFMAFEWVVPTAFGVYILKPYFDSFLKEAGKDHYLLLKSGLKKIVEKGKLIKARFITARESTKKLSQDYNQSIVVSIELQTKNNRHIKLLFDNELDKSDWEDAIDQLLDLVIENYELFPNDKLSKQINDRVENQRHIVYGIINPKTKKVEFYDDRKLCEKYK